MGGYLRVLARSAAAAAAVWTAYRADFLAALLGALVEAAGRVAALFALVRAGVLDLAPDEGLVYLGVASIAIGFFRSVVGPNLVAFSERVWEGSLEFVLLRPKHPVFLLLVQTASPWGLPDLLAGAALLSLGHRALGAQAAVLGSLAIGPALLVAYLFAFLLALVGFFSVHVHNLVHLVTGLFAAGQYPVRAYALPVRVFLTFVVPVYGAVNLPAELALGRVGPVGLLGLWVGVAVFWLLADRLFRLAVRAYASASG